MKKLLNLVLSLTAMTVLSSCNIYSVISMLSNSSSEEISSSESTSSSESSSSTSSSTPGRKYSSSSSESESESSSCSSKEESSSSYVEGDGYYKLDSLTSNLTYKDVGYAYGTDTLQATGESKCLVVPVEFTDYAFSEEFLNNLEKAFKGNGSEDTGYWESLSSYYTKSSDGKANLSFEIADKYEIGIQAGTLYNKFSSSSDVGGEATYYVLEKVYNAYKTKYNNFEDFDADQNGYIDGIYLIYSCPDSYNNAVRLNGRRIDKDGDLFWAFTNWYYSGSMNPSLTSPIPNAFIWMSYSFFYEGCDAPAMDCHTLIHESGHMFGLDDYYCDDNIAGGCSMMDLNIMDLDGFSKTALGWTSAYVVEDSCTINLKPISSDHEVIVVAPSNRGTTTFNNNWYNEYLLIELYTPDGLNEADVKKAYCSRSKGPSVSGIRLWHVDARLALLTNSGSFSKYVETFTKEDAQQNYYYVAASNTYKMSGVNENYNLLSIIHADKSSYSDTNDMKNASLFQTGNKFEIGTYSKYFPNSKKLNNGKSFNFTINFDSVSSTGATITFQRSA